MRVKIEPDWRFIDAVQFTQFELNKYQLITLIGESHVVSELECVGNADKYIRIADYVAFSLNDNPNSKVLIEACDYNQLEYIGSSVIRSISSVLKSANVQKNRIKLYDIRRKYLSKRNADNISLQDVLYSTEWPDNIKKEWIRREYIDNLTETMLDNIVNLDYYESNKQVYEILIKYKNNILHEKNNLLKKLKSLNIQRIKDILKELWMSVTDYNVIGIIMKDNTTDFIVIGGFKHIDNIARFIDSNFGANKNLLIQSRYNRNSKRCLSIHGSETNILK